MDHCGSCELTFSFQAHAAIRADPTPKAKKVDGEAKPKSFKKQRMSLQQRKGRVAQKKAAFLALQ